MLVFGRRNRFFEYYWGVKTMVWVSIVAGLIMFFSFLAGVKDGMVKAGFSLLVTIIAIPIAGAFYGVLAKLLSFLPGDTWEHFLGFFIAFGVVCAVLSLLAILPRKIIDKLWPKIFPFRLLGGIFNLVNSAIGLTVFALTLGAFPIWHWLAEAVTEAGVIVWLVNLLGFVQGLMPEVFRIADTFVAIVLFL